jgi:serine/threonine-protein kinase
MNLKQIIVTFTICAMALETGCVGVEPRSATPPLQPEAARTGVAPRFMTILHFDKAFAHSAKPDGAAKDLYVSDFDNAAINILRNRTYKFVGAIPLDDPDGNFADTAGNLYVASPSGNDISEYAPGATSPMFTYTSGMSDPVGVSVDTRGNVYEADYSPSGFVNEYAQESNAIAETCSLGGQVEGVAIDRRDDVFVDYIPSGGGGKIVEYKHGLKRCKATAIPVSLGFPGGMVLDKSGNIVVCDQNAPAVDIIAPPYRRVTRTLGSDYSDPFHITIDKDNHLAFVTDVNDAVVRVLKYPSGAEVTTLGGANGLAIPSSAVDGVNAVY